MTKNIPKTRKTRILLLAFLVYNIFLIPVSALRNPAAVYCTALGYSTATESTEEGEIVLCQLSNGQNVDAWDFVKCKVAPESSYCATNGYEARYVEDSEICKDCCVCVLQNETEIEVTKLMNLSFEETTCGDLTCGFPEDFSTCPQDCPSGSFDGYCDGVEDGTCDQDCLLQNKGIDIDCPICGDNKCETDEAQEDCCIDCGCSEGLMCIDNNCLPCGDGKCETDYENPNTCSLDCPSGSSDRYCDAANDKKCDPDCFLGEDSDCVTTTTPQEENEETTQQWLLPLIVLVIIFLAVLMIALKLKERKTR